MEKEKIECCSENQVHPDLLKIVNDTMPKKRNCMILQNYLKCLEIPPVSASCLSCLKQRCVSVILQRYCQ